MCGEVMKNINFYAKHAVGRCDTKQKKSVNMDEKRTD
jgi:hypothetical protein